MTEAESRDSILGNGYEIVRENDSRVVVRENIRSSRTRDWIGVNWRDLASSFNLHERVAGK